MIDFYRLSHRQNDKISDTLLQKIAAALPEHQMQDFDRGEPLLLYIWASWCGVCQTTSYAVNRISEEHPVVTIALKSGGISQVKMYMKQYHYAFPLINDERGIVSSDLYIEATPSFFIINKEGHILYYSVGVNSEPSLRAKLLLF